MNRSLNPFLASLLILAITAIYGRAHRLADVSIEHFDEGVYASNLFIGPPEFRYPFQELYAPPLFPAAIEWVFILFGATAQHALWVNVLLGSALVLALGWTASQLRTDSSSDLGLIPFPVSAAATMLIAAAAEIFLQYSRTALTDIPLTLWLVLAVGAGARGLTRGDWKWVVAGGCLTALAWWTKYNGWLPIAILGAGVAGWSLFDQRLSRTVGGPVVRFLVLTVIAIGLWLPCLSALQKTGGYAAVAANHAGYVSGFSGWGSSALRHLQVDQFYTGWLTAAGMAIACVAVWLLSSARLPAGTPRANFHIPRLVICTLSLAGGVLLAGLLPVLLGLSLFAFAPLFSAAPPQEPQVAHRRKRKGSEEVPDSRPTTLGTWILLAWILGLLLATPMYRPFPRLILPLTAGLLISAGVGLEAILTRRRKGVAAESPLQPERGDHAELLGFAALVAGTLLVATVASVNLLPQPALEGRSGLVIAARQIETAIQADLSDHPSSNSGDVQALIAVYGEPGLFFSLSQHYHEGGPFAAQPVSSTSPVTGLNSNPTVPVYLVTGPHARDAAEELSGNRDVRLVATLEYSPSHLVLLDDFSPAEASGRASEKIQVWTRER